MNKFRRSTQPVKGDVFRELTHDWCQDTYDRLSVDYGVTIEELTINMHEDARIERVGYELALLIEAGLVDVVRGG